MRTEHIPYLLVAVPLLPFLAAIINMLFFAVAEKTQNQKLQYAAIAVALVAVLGAIAAHFSLIYIHPSLTGEGSATIVNPLNWLILNYPLRLDWAVRFDGLTTVMVGVVLFVGLMVQVFSIGYLGDRRHDYARYFAWLSFFMFSMLLLVVAANMFVFFVAWEAVGLSSYKLISFYIEKDIAQRAGKKAFIMNRIGDAALLLACFALFRVTNTADFREIAAAFAKGGIGVTHANFIALMVFIAASAKSAQIPLYTWLPDAMTGPTPVSALIHAATMVTAGIFLMLRLEPVLVVAPDASQIIAWAGGLTAFIAAFAAVAQTDIKKVLAFSTVSQLGLMVLAVGSGAYTAAFFHLFTHAFFKAMLFLSAGAVITYSHHEQNIRQMGGFIRTRPALALLFWLALAALAGIPGLSGFFSKDHILTAAFSLTKGGFILGALALAASLLTAFYSFRLGIVVLHGRGQGHEGHANHHEPGISFYLPLALLAIPAVLAGWSGIPSFFTGAESAFFEFIGRNIPAPASMLLKTTTQPLDHHQELVFIACGVGVAALGALAAIVYYGLLGRRPVADGAYRPALTRLSFHKLYIDEIYDFVFVRPYRAIADKISVWDFRVLPAISDGIGFFTEALGAALARLQNGIVAHYAAFAFAGIVVLLLIVLGSTS